MKNITRELLVSLLMLLFLYAAVMKLLHFESFKEEMQKQVFPDWMKGKLVYLIPSLELIITAGLTSQKTRRIGLIASLIVMLLFTIYAIGAFTNLFPNVPCSCGGIISLLTWKQHVLFNLLFVIISLILLINHRSLITKATQEKQTHKL